ncbi:glutathione peroxidase [Sporomusaceae bacterium BoRhaA]|uniref:glutathione peroxidase n=1 Tax=Pelorhabdus rhamnosifermentans TaxID=2772457 RepID=UPI001C060E66|nr:glutathione peroxidase [Pelorhabdus rhamnosifermentans]MBU2700071.1 glutathione peroxidase [Pelorhabdus rhamnosifermentans]
MNVYDFTAMRGNGQEVLLKEYEGKVLIIVNTASKCGFTPQYADLEKLNREYANQGLEILGFPCNQFAEQEPAENHEIQNFCQVNFGVTFPIFAKTDVRGAKAHPLFSYLSEAAPFQGWDLNNPKGNALQTFLKEKFPQYLNGNSIKWNFTKFLVDRSGHVVKRFEPYIQPLDMVDEIKKLL